ncbi:hypothetical protein M378DRAFT_625135 [Amanita muscaria Koide BX008]|uniref:Uncharacterized protein n=1 Tax=Amanita muscaria (strain Koide BX008) TaxID=946122 RepID=A0A0C2TT98_AMAMK|nr:hypothetical protein M378DRAFT_625135 [Amanita muscaria Koide BX008]
MNAFICVRFVSTCCAWVTRRRSSQHDSGSSASAQSSSSGWDDIISVYSSVVAQQWTASFNSPSVQRTPYKPEYFVAKLHSFVYHLLAIWFHDRRLAEVLHLSCQGFVNITAIGAGISPAFTAWLDS